MNSKTFDLCSLSCDFEESFEPATGYITPHTMSPHPAFPPRFVFKSTPIVLSDYASLESDLYIPDPLMDEDQDGESLATTLLPRFISLPVETLGNSSMTDHLSLPSLENLTEDTMENMTTDTRDDDHEEDEDDGYAGDFETECSSKKTIESAPPMPTSCTDNKSREEIGYDSLPENELPVNLKLPLTTNHPLNLKAMRRKSIGAFAA